MSKRTTEMRLPKICAWCGSNETSSLYPVEVSAYRSHTSFSLPVCKSCEARLKKEARLREEYKSLVRKSGLIGMGIGFIIGAIAGVLIFSGLDYLSAGGLLMGGIVIGVVGGMLGVYIGRAVGANKHRDHPGRELKYVHESYEMAWGSVKYSRFDFNNEYFAKSFAALNPNLVKKK